MPIAHHGGLFRRWIRGIRVINRPAGRGRPSGSRPASVRGVTAATIEAALSCGLDLPARDSIRMTRFLIFAAMAPPLGFVVAFWVMLQIANWLAGGPNTFDVAQMMMLPTIYLIGLIPALAAAWFDHVLAKRHVSHRIALHGAVRLCDQLSAADRLVLVGLRPRAGSAAVRPYRRGAVGGVLMAGGGRASDGLRSVTMTGCAVPAW